VATFVIDGYNLLHQLPAEKGPQDLSERRRRLEFRLRGFLYAGKLAARLIVVYDGERGMAGPPRRERGFEIIFSRPPRTADDVILDLCRQLESEPEVHVVTSDITDIASKLPGLRVRHWTSQEFLSLLEKRRRRASGGPRRQAGGEAGEAGEKPGEVTGDEVAEWARRFGFPREEQRE
jgi:predicted RNA-binding protein with PIN domain